MYSFGRVLCLISLPLWSGLPYVAFTSQASAQAGAPQGVYTLNQERFFTESMFGKRVVQEVSARSKSLARENRRMENELKAEEADLTKKRPSLAPAEFRSLADAFDKKVESIRTGQAKKTNDLSQWSSDERQRFFAAAFPVLLKLAQDIGASVILDLRSAIISSDQINITAAAIKRMDDTLGDGAQKPKE